MASYFQNPALKNMMPGFGHDTTFDWIPRQPDLPQGLNPHLLQEYLDPFSCLLSKIHVTYVSEQSPKFWPYTKIQNPDNNVMERKMERHGLGWVERVDIYPNQSCPDKTCDCDECRNSLTPEREFAYIRIITSSSLVFDQEEGKSISCSLFPTKLHNLNKTQSVFSSEDTDRSELVFVTHYLDAAKQLTSLLELVKEKDNIKDLAINYKLSDHLSANLISIKIRSIGNYSIGTCFIRDNNLVYTNEAEKDDVGAPVIVLGNKHLDVYVCGHTGQDPQHPAYGYSRSLNYLYNKLRKKF